MAVPYRGIHFARRTNANLDTHHLMSELKYACAHCRAIIEDAVWSRMEVQRMVAASRVAWSRSEHLRQRGAVQNLAMPIATAVAISAIASRRTKRSAERTSVIDGHCCKRHSSH
jgi:hypothetical protein